jgi:hypothetical protein
MDEGLFRKLFEQGMISEIPPEMWMPMHTKDKKWQNYYMGRGGVTMHLAGGWMINVDTFELNQIEINDIDFSSKNLSLYITEHSNNLTNDDITLVKSVQSVFDQLGYEYETFNDNIGHLIVVRHKFSILGDKAPLTLKISEYGFDPNKSMSKEFENELYYDLPDRFEVVVNHVPEYDDDGEDLGTFGETGIEFSTKIDQPITVDDFPEFVEQRRKEIDAVLARLSKYRFNSQNGDIEQNFYPLHEALESDDYKKAKGSLTFPLGKDETGKFVIADLHELPNIMAAGQTGSGKSNFTEGTLILSLLHRYSAEYMKLILIDPKMVQFTQYNGIPHLLRPVITTPKDSKNAIDWLLVEMKNRISVLENSGHKDIKDYNSSGKKHLPFIVVIIDEVADLMMVDGEYYQKSFIELLQKSKTVGIHIYIGTSRPSDDILPSNLRNNFGAKIVFKTASSVDSQKLINADGAEKLLGKGDLLFKSAKTNQPIRLQAPYVTPEDITKILKDIKQ